MPVFQNISNHISRSRMEMKMVCTENAGSENYLDVCKTTHGNRNAIESSNLGEHIGVQTGVKVIVNEVHCLQKFNTLTF
jgi:hypothetical protein